MEENGAGNQLGVKKQVILVWNNHLLGVSVDSGSTSPGQSCKTMVIHLFLSTSDFNMIPQWQAQTIQMDVLFYLNENAHKRT